MSENLLDTGMNHLEQLGKASCGTALQQAREQQGLSVHDIASKLRLSHKQIEALEADNFAALPESTIVRGFIRNYAKLLKIDAEPLLNAYSAIVPSKVPAAFTVQPTSSMKVTSYQKPKTASYIGIGLAALLALGIWFFYQNYIQKPKLAETSENVLAPGEVDAGMAEPLLEPALPRAEREAAIELNLPPADVNSSEVKPAEVKPMDVKPLDAKPTDAKPTEVRPAEVKPSEVKATEVKPLEVKPTAKPPANANNARELNPSLNPSGLALTTDATLSSTAAGAMPKVNGMATLAFDASQETWVSIMDARGKEIYSKTIFAGSRESVNVKPPVSVVVGNALGVRLDMNGMPVDLAPHMRGNVARVKLK